jgi:hypothetical protein
LAKLTHALTSFYFVIHLNQALTEFSRSYINKNIVELHGKKKMNNNDSDESCNGIYSDSCNGIYSDSDDVDSDRDEIDSVNGSDSGSDSGSDVDNDSDGNSFLKMLMSYGQLDKVAKLHEDEIIKLFGLLTDLNAINLVKTKEIIRLSVLLINSKCHSWFLLRSIFARKIGYGIPSKLAIDVISVWVTSIFKESPESKMVDFGCGSGIWCALLNDAGIPRDKIIAVDLPADKKTHTFELQYWDKIIEDVNYNTNPNDILFISWGSMSDSIIEDYVNKGGRWVIILGEREAATSPSYNHFGNDSDGNDGDSEWEITTIRVPGSCTFLSDGLTLNKLKIN